MRTRAKASRMGREGCTEPASTDTEPAMVKVVSEVLLTSGSLVSTERLCSTEYNP